MNIVVRDDEGREQDITEGVQALYDLVLNSMDWGSGFLSAEDARPVALLARACGFERAAEAERYLRERRHSEEAAVFITAKNKEYGVQRQEGWQLSRPWYGNHGVPIEHDHVMSTAGRCMWPGCKELGEMDPL